ncbi:MAG: thiol reductant ABC exporter subunit CydD [Propionibacteriaceae bacterium]|nr:thiol reductant ABC exporter subunit CydD [Propionibacteriaceae bacterium]
MAGPVEPRLLKRAGAARVHLAASVVVGVVTAVFVIAQAWLLAHAITVVFHYRALPPDWVLTLALLLAVFVARGVLSWVSSVVAHRSSATVKSQLRRDVLAAHLRRPTASSASLVRIVTTGLDALDGYFSKFLPQLGLAATVPFLVGAVILWADWPSALIVAFTLPLIPVFMALIGWTTQAATRRSFARADRLANHFADLIQGLPTLQAFARARAQRKGVVLTEGQYRSETMKVLYVSFLSSFALELLASLSVAVVAVTVGFRLAFGEMPFHAALFILILAPEAFLPVRQVGVHFHDSADGVAAARAALDLIGDDPAPACRDLPQGSSLRLEGVGFTWPGADSPAVAGLDLMVPEGRVVAVTGPSGGGKSTALGLVLGFHSPDSGRVLVDGVDLAELDPAAWRRRVAWVPQDPGMVAGTVGNNVRLGIEATDDEVARALLDAGADFPASKGVGDDGEGLSAGERRRVAVARALLRIRSGARLLVLDEPTAGLDAATEEAVIRAVRDSGAGALVVTHRPAVLAAADEVVTL